MSEPHQQPDPPEEPLWRRAAIIATATAVIALLVAFGVPISEDQQAAILALVAIAAPLVVAQLARGTVYSPATVRALLAKARNER